MEALHKACQHLKTPMWSWKTMRTWTFFLVVLGAVARVAAKSTVVVAIAAAATASAATAAATRIVPARLHCAEPMANGAAGEDGDFTGIAACAKARMV